MKFFYIIFIFILFFRNTFCQNIPDSLHKIENYSCPQIAIEYQKAANYFRNNNPIIAQELYTKAYQSAILCNEKELAAANVNMIGITYFEQSDYQEALKYFEIASKTSSNNINKAIYQNNIIEIYIQLGLFDDAFIVLDSITNIFEKSNFNRGIVAVNTNIANIYKFLNQNSKATFFFKKAIMYPIEDENLIGNIYINYADNYLKSRNLTKALYLITKAEKIFIKINNVSKLAECYSIFGKIFSKINKYEYANFYYFKSLNLSKPIHGYNNLIQIYSYLSKNYTFDNNFDYAKLYLDSAEYYYCDSLNYNSKLHFFEQKHNFYLTQNIYDSAYFYFKKYNYLKEKKDSIIVTSIIKIKKFQLNKKQKVIIANAKIKLKTKVLFWFFLLFFVIAIALLIYLLIKNQKIFKTSYQKYIDKFILTNKYLSESYKKIEAKSIAFIALQKAAQSDSSLNVLLQSILEEIINIEFLNLEKKGSIFLKDSNKKLKMVASVNMQENTDCTYIDANFCLCGAVFSKDNEYLKKLKYYGDNIYSHNDHNHFISILTWEKEELGVLNFYLGKNLIPKDYEIEFLNNFVLTISGIIKQKTDSEQYKTKASELMSLLQKNYAQSIKIDQQKDEVEKYAQQLENQSNVTNSLLNDIYDSINYASYIINSLLPSKKYIETLLKDYFIIHKQKNTVGGDFYLITKTKNQLVIAVADSTGHGVPGAFLSLLGITFLQDIILGSDNINPAYLLEKLRKKIKSVFKFADTGVGTNGFDIGLIVIDTYSNILTFSGAQIPLYIFSQNVLHKFLATRSPVGNHYNELDFENSNYLLKDNDIIYFFTDGFPDQFGGKENKKYTRRKFLELLEQIGNMDITEQRMSILESFYKWKGENDQTDDITMITFKWNIDNL